MATPPRPKFIVRCAAAEGVPLRGGGYGRIVFLASAQGTSWRVRELWPNAGDLHQIDSNAARPLGSCPVLNSSDESVACKVEKNLDFI